MKVLKTKVCRLKGCGILTALSIRLPRHGPTGLKQNALEAGNHCVARRCPPGRGIGYRPGPGNVFDVKCCVVRGNCGVCDLPVARGHDVVGRNVCLPAHCASKKVAGGPNRDYFLTALAVAVFCRVAGLCAFERIATTAGNPS